MSTSFTIRVTKEIIARAKNCGQDEELAIGDNCAIALALQDLFPDVFVTGAHIHPFGFDQEKNSAVRITLPAIAQDFIKVFDPLVKIPGARSRLSEFEFEIFIPDGILDQIDIDDIQEVVPVRSDR